MGSDEILGHKTDGVVRKNVRKDAFGTCVAMGHQAPQLKLSAAKQGLRRFVCSVFNYNIGK